jgi:RNA polymerase sigma factor (sigma-70 family)
MTVDFLTKAFIRLRGRRGTSSEDALQDAFCRLWGKKFVSEVHAEAMLARTARNIAIDEYRKSSSRRTESIEGRQVPAEEDSPIEKEALFRKVEASINKELTPLQQEIVRLHEYAGLTYDDIASRLDMQPAAVRMQISRARKLIREKYRNEYEGL